MRNESDSELALQWLRLAKADLNNAELTFRMDSDSTYTTICFHAHQTVEKCLKAILTFQQVDFPKSHDLYEISVLVQEFMDFKDIQDSFKRLTPYAVTTRYPVIGIILTKQDAKTAIEIADDVYHETTGYFSKQGLTLPE